jgi:hypothetical protein
MRPEEILKGNFSNHILPFLWVHGESEEVYRKNVRAIYNANIRAFCIEARPHKEFCQEQWWNDLAILLDEAKKLGMKVWILDDKHFPTGFAGGAVLKAEDRLRRQSVLIKQIPVKSSHVKINLNAEKLRQKASFGQFVTDVVNKNYAKENKFHDTRVISVTAVEKNGRAPLSLADHVKDSVLDWEAPDGSWTVNICYLSRNCGVHRSYINMMDKESCRILIDSVYEPHYQHFRDMFGTVIAGFFSDEPELGNGFMYHMYNFLGTEQDLPWSGPLEAELRDVWKEKYEEYLPLLWLNTCDEGLTAKVRYEYMDHVSRLVETCFSKQIGTWCADHGVEYIGHLVEDNNQHARTGTSLGHYFRGLKWQSMAGIDIIGGSVYPQREILEGHTFIWKDEPVDGEFYHFALAKMGSSLGQLNPNMKDRTMCELFGNYSWSEGVRLEKFLVDHCLVRGINYFVPHAFDCKAYPDKDCPPHFYANGNDPLYRHFGQLMGYTNRIASLFDDCLVQTPVAVLYHAEAEWCSVCDGKRANPQTAGGEDALREGYMLMQKPARILQENQIDFHFIPADAFGDREFYHTEIGEKLVVNGKPHDLLIVPYAKYITAATAEAICEWREKGGRIVFLEDYPSGLCEGGSVPDSIRLCDVVPLKGLKKYLSEADIAALSFAPENNRIRAMYAKGEQEAVLIVNEDNKVYQGNVTLPWRAEETSLYDPWENRMYAAEVSVNSVAIQLRPSESVVLFRKSGSGLPSKKNHSGEKRPLTDFRISYCRSIDYPNFKPAEKADGVGDFSKWYPKFSGFIRYDTTFDYDSGKNVQLVITDAREGVEVFVNDKSLGIQIIPEFRFDITDSLKKDRNRIRIEVATTLERENLHFKNPESAAPTGITGEVCLEITDRDLCE